MDQIELGERLKKLRGNRTRHDISVSCGFAPGTYALWEKGARSIGALNLMTVCRVLGVTISDILDKDEQPEIDELESSFLSLKHELLKLHKSMPDCNPNVIELFKDHAHNIFPIVSGLADSNIAP